MMKFHLLSSFPRQPFLCAKTKRLALFAAFILLTGCQTLNSSEQEVVKNLPTDPRVSNTPLPHPEPEKIARGNIDYVPIRNKNPPQLVAPTGSLFNENEYYGLFLHKTNYKIGDMVQVVIEEETKATKNQQLKKDKASEMSVGPLQVRAGGINLERGQVNVDHQQGSSFESSASSEQFNSVEGVINVFVKEILNNGNLIVAGEKWLKLNEGEEFVRVIGEIRTKDITAQNTVSSTKLGNPKIEFSGVGELQENQRGSVIDKILSVFN
ncbi:flagellar basal body L-ring protein FlgH [Planctobacterium marinum]|uniref:flagellar basal body L-ring protein FlgH n=1 Tax=Planctobacterium marinum TaxID=1631968 RepID=UPI001E3BBE30|nr:flagellar basal body L-ring protein FlgH [Planctobacterium marinum]MCC2604905.1 flagellar basal body L-ring protein FlgH [Planctobacterium marinum]